MKYFLYLFSFVSLLLCACQKKVEPVVYDFEQIKQRDTLTVATLWGSSSYFLLKGEEMGFDYELCKRFAADNNLELKVLVANNVAEMVDSLQAGVVDMIAYRLPITNELKQKIDFMDNEYVNSQVLVQRDSKTGVSSVVELIGKEVFVNKGSKYEERLKGLNDEIGGGIIIKTVDDSLAVDNLIEMVSQGKIDFTVAENDIAMLNKTYFKNIDCKMPVSFEQRSAWAVRKSTPHLKAATNKWFESNSERKFYASLYKKYFVQAKYFGDRGVKIAAGAISPYDALFKKYAKELDWDWRLLAAMCYEESRFDSSAVSWSGARGIMQLMPRTFAVFEPNDSLIDNPEASIRVATEYIERLEDTFKQIQDADERLKFILAAYNAGHGHVLDAMALTEKYGKDKYVWYGNVEEYLLLKSRKEFYADPVVKCGYFRGEFAIRYVSDVLNTYERFKLKRK